MKKNYLVRIGDGWLRLDSVGSFWTDTRVEASRFTAREARLLVWALSRACVEKSVWRVKE